MLKSFKLLLAAAVMCFMTTSAHAVAFIPSAPYDLDFGEVSVGDTRTISWNFSWSLEDGESLDTSRSPLFTIRDRPELGYEATRNSCDSNVNNCFFDIKFTPSTLGPITLKNLVQFDLYMSSTETPVVTYSLDTTGVGIDPIPLPAAFPLLAGALSLLGLFGWRRKRMVVA